MTAVAATTAQDNLACSIYPHLQIIANEKGSKMHAGTLGDCVELCERTVGCCNGNFKMQPNGQGMCELFGTDVHTHFKSGVGAHITGSFDCAGTINKEQCKPVDSPPGHCTRIPNYILETANTSFHSLNISNITEHNCAEECHAAERCCFGYHSNATMGCFLFSGPVLTVSCETHDCPVESVAFTCAHAHHYPKQCHHSPLPTPHPSPKKKPSPAPKKNTRPGDVWS